MKKVHFLIVLFLCGLSVGNVCASASAAAAAADEEAVANALGQELIEAARERKEEKVEALLKVEGINVNATDRSGSTALIAAAYQGNDYIVELLLKAGADVNATNRYGETALLRAALFGHKNIVKMLLQEGADKDIKNEKGLTAERLAQNNGDHVLANMIRDFVLPPGRRTKRAIDN